MIWSSFQHSYMTAQLYSVKFLMATVSTLATSSLSCSLWHLVSAPLYASVQPTNTQGTLALTAATASKFDDVLQVTMTTHKTTGKNSYCRTTWTDCTVITQWVSKSGYLYPAPELWRRLNGAGRSRTGACLVSAWRRSLTGPTTIVLVADGSMRLVLWLQNFYVLCSKCLCCIPLDS